MASLDHSPPYEGIPGMSTPADDCLAGIACWNMVLLVQVVALVGPSGGGKSSIVKLVERFYLPAAGAVLLDGRDVGLYDAKWLKRHVALVAQV